MMSPVQRNALTPALLQALQAVEAGLHNSFSPYSGFCVGAGLLLDDGRVITGYNYESASYGLTLCAERSAIACAQAAGHIERVQAVVIATRRREPGPEEPPFTPCGACRQWIAELSGRLGRDLPVLTFWSGAATGLKGSARELLPDSFS